MLIDSFVLLVITCSLETGRSGENFVATVQLLLLSNLLSGYLTMYIKLAKNPITLKSKMYLHVLLEYVMSCDKHQEMLNQNSWVWQPNRLPSWHNFFLEHVYTIYIHIYYQSCVKWLLSVSPDVFVWCTWPCTHNLPTQFSWLGTSVALHFIGWDWLSRHWDEISTRLWNCFRRVINPFRYILLLWMLVLWVIPLFFCYEHFTPFRKPCDYVS